MANHNTFSLAQNAGQSFTRSAVVRVIRLTLAVAIFVTGLGLSTRPAQASGPDPIGQANSLGPNAVDAVTLFELVVDGQGDEAVQRLAAEAVVRGNWAAAPGNTVAFDPGLAWNIRGAVRVIDLPPAECADTRTNRFIDECQIDFITNEDVVRLGPSTFADPLDQGRNPVARPTFDDVLSTYIEEVGHSWQEYLYETDGLGSGPRTRPTGYYEAMHFAPGSEYQVKLYILNLDGTVLHLSAEERARFIDAICEADGYANPVGREVPAYGAPAGWPNPEGWPTVAPTEAEHAALCTTLRG